MQATRTWRANAATRLSDDAFATRICVDWARRMGIFFDLDRVAVRTTTTDGGFAGRGIFATQPSEPGDFFAMVPSTATLQAVDLFHSERRYFADLATLPLHQHAEPVQLGYGKAGGVGVVEDVGAVAVRVAV